MFQDTIEQLSEVAQKKVSFLKSNKTGYLVSAALAGSFIGLGSIASLSAGSMLAQANSPFTRLVTSLSFCIALTMVVFLGTELFTGNNYVMTLGYLNKKVSFGEMLSIWGVSWVGNLIGAIILSLLFVQTGAVSSGANLDFFETIALTKVSFPPLELFVRSILCNYIVCLAVAVSARTKHDSAKILLIFISLFSFIISGFEHSIANMTTFTICLLEPGITAISFSKACYALILGSFGNLIGGAVFMGFTTFLMGERK